MKTVLIILLAITPLTMVQAQNNMLSKKELKQLAKEDKRAKQRAEQEEQAKLIKLLLEQKKFVLEADYLSNNRGERFIVNSTINFIAIDSTNGVLQLGSNFGLGYNGVGGITVEGIINKYELRVKEGKKGDSFYLSIMLMSSLGTYDVLFSISTSGKADATIRGNTAGSLTYSGNIESLEESLVYKATPNY